VASWRQLFVDAAEPDLASMVGLHQAQYLGPAWLRWGGPLGVALLGMPGWAGKRFSVPAEGADVLQGCNLRRSSGRLVTSLPMTARIEASVVDGRRAIVATYAADAPWPWRSVRDEFRSVAPAALLGLSFGFPLVSGGLPFVLVHRA
jgi:hypothetical protein